MIDKNCLSDVALSRLSAKEDHTTRSLSRAVLAKKKAVKYPLHNVREVRKLCSFYFIVTTDWNLHHDCAWWKDLTVHSRLKELNCNVNAEVIAILCWHSEYDTTTGRKKQPTSILFLSLDLNMLLNMTILSKQGNQNSIFYVNNTVGQMLSCLNICWKVVNGTVLQQFWNS